MKDYSELGTLLTREEAKKIRGGMVALKCTEDSDCPRGACSYGECVENCIAWCPDKNQPPVHNCHRDTMAEACPGGYTQCACTGVS